MVYVVFLLIFFSFFTNLTALNYDKTQLICKLKPQLLNRVNSQLFVGNFLRFQDYQPKSIRVLGGSDVVVSNTSLISQSLGLSLRDNIPLIFEYEKDVDIESAKKALEQSKYFEWVQYDYYLQLLDVPNDPGYNSQYYLSLVRAAQSWSFEPVDKTIRIGVVDSGIDYNHPDLRDNIWVNPDIKNGVDLDGDQYQNDLHGWDPYDNDIGVKNDPMDTNSHGTMVAGIIAGIHNNGLGIAGVNKSCKLLAINVLDKTSGSAVKTSYLVEGLYYALAKQVRIVNISIGGKETDQQINFALREAVALLINQGVLVVAAAGNNDSRSYGYINIDQVDSPLVPATIPGVITVSASDRYGEYSKSISLYGESVDIMAPGEQIYSTSLKNDYKASLIDGAYYSSKKGTSFAAPIVTGGLGFLLSIYPTLTNDQVYKYLTQSAIDKGTVGKDLYSGYGLMDILAMISLAQDDSVGEPVKSNVLRLSGKPDGAGEIVNAPNPFNPTTDLMTRYCFSISHASNVSIKIYSLGLQLVKELFDGALNQGYHSHIHWDGRDEFGNIVPNGTYIALINVNNSLGNVVQHIKTVVLR
ncbi:hypothetical protein DID75_02845 [Candidatus Marinamargulisbacteria bacterium SCGC AG-410-N11]|nr:hypothetical protein DID75_02845 [Candidatus Marinamargulisbacteria bacterium SCGC AG-410-N11]